MAQSVARRALLRRQPAGEVAAPAGAVAGTGAALLEEEDEEDEGGLYGRFQEVVAAAVAGRAFDLAFCPASVRSGLGASLCTANGALVGAVPSEKCPLSQPCRFFVDPLSQGCGHIVHWRGAPNEAARAARTAEVAEAEARAAFGRQRKPRRRQGGSSRSGGIGGARGGGGGGGGAEEEDGGNGGGSGGGSEEGDEDEAVDAGGARPANASCAAGHEWCWRCRGGPHAPCPCGLWRGWGRLVERHLREARLAMGLDPNGGGGLASGDGGGGGAEAGTLLWLAANTKKCPQCRTPTEKNEGCNHMSCRRCRHEYCWICMKPWREHSTETGGYYKCNRFEATSSGEDHGGGGNSHGGGSDGGGGGARRAAALSTDNRGRGSAAESARRAADASQAAARFIHHYTRFQVSLCVREQDTHTHASAHRAEPRRTGRSLL